MLFEKGPFVSVLFLSTFIKKVLIINLIHNLLYLTPINIVVQSPRRIYLLLNTTSLHVVHLSLSS